MKPLMNRRRSISVLWETLKEFAKNTSIHGIKHSVKKEINRNERIFWVFVALSGLMCSGYMSMLFWNRFASGPTRTSILTTYASTTAVPFPAVTICNINRIMVNKVDDFIKLLKIEEKQMDLVKRTLPQFLAFTHPSAIKYNISDLETFEDILRTNNFTDVNSVMMKITQSCSEMLMKCEWNFDVISCLELFEESLGPDGFCCSFNYVTRGKKRALRTFFSGARSGLTTVLNPMIQAVQHSTLQSTGLKVIVHNPYDYPGDGSISKIIPGGRITYLQLVGTKIVASYNFRQLSMEQRHCAYPDELALRYFPNYADTNCFTECDAMLFYDKCHCVPFYLSFTDKQLCSPTKIPCLAEVRKLGDVAKNCNCPTQCEDSVYEVLRTTTKFETEFLTSTSSLLDNLTLDEDTILLHVYFVRESHKVLMRNPITSRIYLLSSFGGIYSLFLGCSFISLIEVLYYCTVRYVVNLKFFRRINGVDKEYKEVRKRTGNDLVLNKSEKRKKPNKRWECEDSDAEQEK